VNGEVYFRHIQPSEYDFTILSKIQYHLYSSKYRGFERELVIKNTNRLISNYVAIISKDLNTFIEEIINPRSKREFLLKWNISKKSYEQSSLIKSNKIQPVSDESSEQNSIANDNKIYPLSGESSQIITQNHKMRSIKLITENQKMRSIQVQPLSLSLFDKMDIISKEILKVVDSTLLMISSHVDLSESDKGFLLITQFITDLLGASSPEGKLFTSIYNEKMVSILFYFMLFYFFLYKIIY
jgi:hypothetical protein